MNVGGWVFSACVAVCAPGTVLVSLREGVGVCGAIQACAGACRTVSLLEWTVSLSVSLVCVSVSLSVGVGVYLIVVMAAQSWTALEFSVAKVLRADRWSGRWELGKKPGPRCLGRVCVCTEREETDGEREPREERR